MRVVRVRHLTDLTEALSLAPRFDRCAAERAREFADEPLAAGVTKAFLVRHFEARETVVLVAENEPGSADAGLCLIGPFEDSWTATRVPMVWVLHVESAERHRGVARAMIGRATELLAERGVHRLAARAGHNDDALISMGERWGFVRHWELMLRE